MSRLIVRPEASLDVEAAAFWYEDRRSGLGRRFLADVDRIFERIEESPLQFPRIEPDVRRALLRKFPYAVYFAADREQVLVLAVLHFRQDTAVWRSRR